MLENKVCAVVVTFYPAAAHIRNLEKLRPQVETLVAVDNGSAEGNLRPLRAASHALDIALIENGANLGIAAALNFGVRWATTHQQNWVALFDQDSTVTEGFIDCMLNELGVLVLSSNVMQIIPRYRDPITGEEEVAGLAADGGPFITRTSGSVFPRHVFEKCGLFTEELFMYCVDDDFSLRLRSMGYSIAQSKSAILLHAAGTPSRFSFFGKKVTTRNYPPEVQYYWARNRVWLMRKHGRKYPYLIYSSLRSLLAMPLKIAVAERMAGKKIRMFLKGILHGAVGKTGPSYRSADAIRVSRAQAISQSFGDNNPKI